jgi:glycosyltransferase involved in cell wall biosynthesis
MRIAHVITRMIVGGAQENTLLCCKDAVRIYGDEAVLITGPSPGPEGELLEREEYQDIPVRLLGSLRRSINPWHDIRGYREIKNCLREYRPDVVHTHSAKAGILGRLAAWSLGIPAIVHTVHGAPFHAFQPAATRTVYRWCETYAAKRCHRMVSVADAMTDQLVAAGVAHRGKFLTIYSGMDVEPLLRANESRAATRAELGFDDSHIVVGKIARLFDLKGHQFVIEAAEQVVQACPNVRFLFVGDGILRQDLERQIAAAGLTDHFRFTGLVDPARIAALIGSIDMLVHASLREGLARALPQALIAGKPVISYDVDGAREVVIPDQTGFLLPPRSVNPMADAIIDLAGNSSKRRQFGQTGRDRFADRFRHEEMARQLRELYVSILDRVDLPSPQRLV